MSKSTDFHDVLDNCYETIITITWKVSVKSMYAAFCYDQMQM